MEHSYGEATTGAHSLHFHVSRPDAVPPHMRMHTTRTRSNTTGSAPPHLMDFGGERMHMPPHHPHPHVESSKPYQPSMMQWRSTSPVPTAGTSPTMHVSPPIPHSVERLRTTGRPRFNSAPTPPVSAMEWHSSPMGSPSSSEIDSLDAMDLDVGEGKKRKASKKNEKTQTSFGWNPTRKQRRACPHNGSFWPRKRAMA